MDPNKLTKLLKAATGPLVALGALIAALGGGHSWLQSALQRIGFPKDVSAISAWAIVGAGALVLLIQASRLATRRSRVLRPERFDLKIASEDDLLGRDRDVQDLVDLIETSNLVFLDGESGSGKSSLVIHGLVPRLKRERYLAICLASYAGDWEEDLTRRAVDVALEALSPDERERLAPQVRNAEGSAAAWDQVLAALEARGRVVLVLDQLDDYQFLHREKFIGEHGQWIPPQELMAQNRFWRTTTRHLAGGFLKLVVITRSDTAAALQSLRLDDRYVSKTIARLETLWLTPLLEQLTRDDGRGPVVENEDDGWQELKRLVHADLQRGGSVLPQQARITFLGLRSLRVLTASEYRRAGSSSGVEALYVRECIRSAALAGGVPDAEVRGLLLKLVLRGAGNIPKTVAATHSELASAALGGARLDAILARLRRDEIIRPSAELDACARWQLDHDYLARAVIAEEALANRYMARLREGAEAWREAGPDIAQRIRSLLPPRTQLALLMSRLRGRFQYRPHRLYAAASALRILPPLLIAGAGVTLMVSVQNIERAYLTESLNTLVDNLITGVTVENRNVMPPKWTDVRANYAYSGRYWQVFPVKNGQYVRNGSRSFSLFNEELPLPPSLASLHAAPGRLTYYDGIGPRGEHLLLLSRLAYVPGIPEVVFTAAEDSSLAERQGNKYLLIAVTLLVIGAGGLTLQLISAD